MEVHVATKVLNFNSNSVKVPWIFCWVPGLFVIPEFFKHYKQPLTPFCVHLIEPEGEVFFKNTGLPLDANDLQIMQGIFFFEQPYDPDKSPTKQVAKTASQLFSKKKVPLNSQFDSPLDPDYHYMITRNNITDFFTRIGSPKAKLPLKDQVKIITNSLEKLALQEYSFSIQLPDNETLTKSDKLVLTFHVDTRSGNFDVLRKMSIEEMLRQPRIEIDLNEIKSIKTDAARILHHMLCAYIPPGGEGKFRQADLEQMLFIHDEIITFDGKDKLIKLILSELNSLKIGWTVKRRPGDDIWQIFRKEF
jgi:hypothetical protein